MQRVIFLGFAPNVTNGFWVMRSDKKVELTSNIADETVFDEAVELPQRKMEEQMAPQPPREDDIYPQKLLDEIMGPEGDPMIAWNWGKEENQLEPAGPQDDPMAIVSEVKVRLDKISDKIWQQEETKPEEIPEILQNEMKESGAIAVKLRDVRNSIGKDRQQWHLALESELQSLRDTGATETVQHVPRGNKFCL